ncbi:MAG: hypothetical protein ACREDY_13210 [Bradyrhizobium sp.]
MKTISLADPEDHGVDESEGVIEHQALDLAVGDPTPMRADEIELWKTVMV